MASKENCVIQDLTRKCIDKLEFLSENKNRTVEEQQHSTENYYTAEFPKDNP